MKENLVIVESPTKAKKIQDYLGDDFVVKSSKGHIRDLQENNLSIDINDNFKPEYVIPAEKAKLVAELKKDAKQAKTVWLASDEDREGEAIAWHLSDVLELPKEKTKRIAFHEITKTAILDAVQNPRDIDMNLVDAQQARRILDRLVGFELSPVLWKKIQPKLSAGRVQSVALRLVVDREREIEAFKSETYYKVTALFSADGSDTMLKATLDETFKTLDRARAFLEQSIGTSYCVSDISSKEGTRMPAAPFTTSTLQQEAARKLGMSVSQTMQIAQKLYEEGLITYMRTDSVNLSKLALATAKKYICNNFGAEYSRPMQYKTKSRGAQEAHEAIRPTFIENTDIEGSQQEKRLYQLIWKRTLASQMTPARLLNTSIEVSGDRIAQKYNIEASKVLFDGFLKLYIESTDDESSEETLSSLPRLDKGDRMMEHGILAENRHSSAPARYNQASLVKKLEELGIGRPSTYSSIIGTLVRGRGYIVEGDKDGRDIEIRNLKLENGKISVIEKTETIGAEKRKLLPQDIGILVSDYLVENFPNVMDYGFTADVEKDFDEIASGAKPWGKVISSFYTPFHDSVRTSIAQTGYSHLEKQIGIDPSDGLMIVAKYGQYGPYVQKGEGGNKSYASLAKGQIIESLTLEEAMKLFQLPRTLGQKDGENVCVNKGPYGPYIRCGKTNVPVPRGKDPLKITLEQALALIEQKENKVKPEIKIISEWNGIQLIDGNYGPYLKADGKNYKLPKGCDASALDEAQARDIISNSTPTTRKRRFSKKPESK